MKVTRRLSRKWAVFGSVAVVLLAVIGVAILVPIASSSHDNGGVELDDEIIDEVAMEGLYEVAEEEPKVIEEATSVEVTPEAEETGVVAVAPARRNLNRLINLQSVVDQWVQNYSYSFQSASVEVYDVDFGTVVASYNANASMWPRSLYKLFYTYDAYAKIDAGIDDANAPYLGSYTLGQCLDLMIRESNNPCAEAMLDEPARAAGVAELVAQLGLTNTHADGLKTSAHDISLLLQHYYRHPEWSAASWQKFRDAALNQAWTYRKGLPSGFNEAAVYDKVGFGYGSGGMDVYNDAAMVEFPTATGGVRRYIVVGMMAAPTTYTALTELGARLERAILYE